MQIALLGDIHGNDLALQAVLASVRTENIDLLLVSGDLVGYYFAPDKVMEMLRPWKKHMIRGNHEDMLASARNNQDQLLRIDRSYGCGIRLALEKLSAAEVDELTALPRSLEIEFGSFRVCLCHGAPWDTDQYVYPDASDNLLGRCAAPGFDAVVMGHTHYPMKHRINNTLLINPGSVGQPRNRNPGADWAVLDTATGSVSLRHENYDSSPLILEAKRRHPDISYLSDVLERR